MELSSVRNALKVASDHKFQSVALPLIGAGTGGHDEESVMGIIQDELSSGEFEGTVIIVSYRPTTTR
jgi:O-acetyl-ADP-ribose deacetylase (regulator of RNase III)